MKVSQILDELHKWAPLNYQESYDNSGLLIGSPQQEIEKILITLDIIESTIEEAILNGHQLIISHHPIIFKGFKSLTGKTMEERVLLKAIKNDIAIIAMHTNLDNVSHGVNAKISEILGLENTRVLEAKSGLLKKLVVYIPTAHVEKLRAALFQAGAGHIGDYSECSYGTEGIGTFKGNDNSQPFVGTPNILHEEREQKLEMIFPSHLLHKISACIYKHHPYEEPAFDIYTLDNDHPRIGAGMIGDFPDAMDEESFLSFLKDKMKTNCVRHTGAKGRKIKKVALCGGSGSFLIRAAKSAKADVYITGDVKYHEFFAADNDFMIADIGHYESEQFTKELIHEFLIKKFPKFAVQISEHQTNPIKYY